MAPNYRPAPEKTKILRTAIKQGGLAVLQLLLLPTIGDDLLARINSELTAREKEVLWAYLVEQDDVELGYILQIQPQSVRNHLADIMTKLSIHTRSALISHVLPALLREAQKF